VTGYPPPHPPLWDSRFRCRAPSNLRDALRIQTGSLMSSMCLSLASCGLLGRFSARLGTRLPVLFLGSLLSVCVVVVFDV
jgi:hypothetical protein